MPGETVLVIDDSPTIQKVVQLVLTKAQYRVETARDGEEGLEKTRAVKPDLILLDFVMPRMNGYQFCRELANEPELKDIPVVLMSAKGDQVGERFVSVMGIVDYITKPFSPDAITTMVQQTLAKFTRPGGTLDEPLADGDGAGDDIDPAELLRAAERQRHDAMDQARLRIADALRAVLEAQAASADAEAEAGAEASEPAAADESGGPTAADGDDEDLGADGDGDDEDEEDEDFYDDDDDDEPTRSRPSAALIAEVDEITAVGGVPPPNKPPATPAGAGDSGGSPEAAATTPMATGPAGIGANLSDDADTGLIERIDLDTVEFSGDVGELLPSGPPDIAMGTAGGEAAATIPVRMRPKPDDAPAGTIPLRLSDLVVTSEEQPATTMPLDMSDVQVLRSQASDSDELGDSGDAGAQAAPALAPVLVAGQLDVHSLVAQALADPLLADIVRTAAASLRAADPPPSFSGDIRLVPIAHVLQLLDAQSQTGVLRLENEGKRLEISYRKGRIEQALGTGFSDEYLFGRVVVGLGLMTQEDFEGFLASRTPGKKLIGTQLVMLGYCSELERQRALVKQTSELIFEALRWRAGAFEFERTTELPVRAVDAALALDVEALLMEGLRRVDEWHLIEREVADFDLVFLRNEQALAQLGRNRLTREEQIILDLVNGKNTVKDIVRKSRRGSFDVSQMLVRLSSINLVRRRVAPVVV